MNDLLKQETIDLLGLDDLTNKKQEYTLKQATLALTSATTEKAVSLLNERDLDEFERLIQQKAYKQNPSFFGDFYSKRGIDILQIYKEEMIKLKIFIKRRKAALKTSEVKEEFFEEFLLDNSCEVISTVGHLSDKTSFLLDVGSLALSILHNPTKNYSSKRALKKRVFIKIFTWIITLFSLFIFDCLVYLIPYLLAKNSVIAKVPEWITAVVPNFVIDLINKL